MEKVNLSNNEKKILKELSVSQYEKGMFNELSREELYVASNRLKGFGFIIAHYAEGNELASARISDEWAVYLKENPLSNENNFSRFESIIDAIITCLFSSIFSSFKLRMIFNTSASITF